MCGHSGVVGNLYSKDLDIFRDMQWAGALRGMHSTGVAAVNDKGDWTIVKSVGSPMMLRSMEGNPLSRIMNTTQRMLMGHNRHATMGAVSDDNAHPFGFENIVGAHNGTLVGRSRHKLVDFDHYGTDSEALFANINHFGPTEVMPEVEGAWALVWYDKRDNTINFLRNKERPFHYCFSQSGQQMYYASEAGMLRWILARNGQPISEAGIMALKEDTLLRFVVPKGNQKFGEPSIQELKGYEWKPSGGHKSDNFFRNEREELEALMEKWAPPSRNPREVILLGERQPEPSGRLPKSLSSLVKQPNGSAGMSDSGFKTVEEQFLQHRTTPSRGTYPPKGSGQSSSVPVSLFTDVSQYNEKAYKQGVRAGNAGKSITNCPYTSKGSHQAKSWYAGRLKGLEDLVMPPASNPIPENHRIVSKVIRAYGGELISEKTFFERTEGGCCTYCGDPSDPKDKIHWMDRKTFFCDPCVTQDLTAQMLFRDAPNKDAA